VRKHVPKTNLAVDRGRGMEDEVMVGKV